MVDWDNIKYIFQVPVRWFKRISDKVGHMYGAGFVRVRQDGYNDGIEVGIDQAQFEEEVKRITGTAENQVSTVDGVGPDSGGNVQLGAVRAINGEYYPDENGNLNIPYGDGKVKSVDWIEPDSAGNVNTGAIKSINGVYLPGVDGDVEVPFGSVKSVDGVTPGANGNVKLNAYTPIDLATKGAIAGPSYEGEQPLSPMSHVHNMTELADAKDDDGNLTFIKSVNTSIKPDRNGNINLPLPSGEGFLVASVDGVKPSDEKGNVALGAVRGIKVGEGEVVKPDDDGIISMDEIEGSVKTVNGVEPDDDGNVDLGDIVHTVNGEPPDDNGNVEVEIEAENVTGLETYTTAIVQRDIKAETTPIKEKLQSLTHTDITDWASATYTFLDSTDVESAGQTVGLDYVSERFICNVNHGHKLSDITDLDEEAEEVLGGQFVTIGTEQTITGEKTFSSGRVDITGESSTLALGASGGAGGTLVGSAGGVALATVDGEVRLAAVPRDGSEQQSSVVIQAPQDSSVLANPPSDECEVANAIATVGWVKKNGGGIKSVDGNTPDDEGAITLPNVVHKNGWESIERKQFEDGLDVLGDVTISPSKTSAPPTLSFGTTANITNTQNGLVASSNKVVLDTQVDQAVLERGPSDSASTVSKAIATVGWANRNLGRVKTVNGTGPDANGNVYIPTGGTVKSVDGYFPDANGDVALGALTSMDVETAGQTVGLDYESEKYVCNVNHGHNGSDVGGMAAGKWVKTDSDGYLTTTKDTPVSLPEGVSPAPDGPSTFLVGVAGQNTTTATFSRAQIYFTRGIATSYTPLTNQSIRVPQIPANVNPPTYFEYVYDAAYDGTTLYIKRYRMNTSGGALIGGQYLTDRVFTIGGGSTSGYSGTVSVVTGVTWDGTKLNISTGNMTITNGVITAYAAGTTSNIDTVAYS